MNRLQYAACAMTVILGGGLFLTQSSAAADDAPVAGWPRNSGEFSAGMVEDSPTTNSLHYFAQVLHSESLDLGDAGTGPGDVELFEEALSDSFGNVVGRDSVRCETVVTSTRCSATFLFPGQGTIEVAGAFASDIYPPLPLAVIGGTGVYEGVSGTYRFWAPAHGGTDLVFHLDYPTAP